MHRNETNETRRKKEERNRHIVPYRTFANVRLEDGDTLELVTLVGGG